MFSTSKTILTQLESKCTPKTFSAKSYVSTSGAHFSKGAQNDNTISDVKIPDPPTNCCMSGCANCVWIAYAEELAKLFRDGGKKSREIIMSKVDDPNMKAFLLTELKVLESKES